MYVLCCCIITISLSRPGCVLCGESNKDEVKESAGLLSGGSGKDRLLAESSPCGCRSEVPVSLLRAVLCKASSGVSSPRVWDLSDIPFCHQP